MRKILPALTALALLTAAPLVRSAEDAPLKSATPPKPATTSEAESAIPSTPRKITRWEDTGMKPAEAREWESYSFKPHEALEWKNADFAPVVARTWSDKGFDPDEAAEWRETTKNNHTLMAELDQSDPVQWKREGFTPRDRLAWLDAGFGFEDAVTLTRAGMSPTDAAWHGHEKLKELKKQDAPAKADTQHQDALSPSWTLSDLKQLYGTLRPHLELGLIIALTIVSFGLALYLRWIRRSNAAERRQNAPDSTTPDTDPEGPGHRSHKKKKAAARLTAKLGEDRHHPARRTTFWTPTTPTCVHCNSTNVRMSRINPRRIAGVTFSEYFRCRECGRHFSNVSYAPLAAAGITIIMLLTFSTAGFIHLISLLP
ncbi:MAG: hypothetical protein EKK49_12610 [Rhodocyclaceae bacterium]|nr:MAG: hypothetical protein EKK49_12610 [Rhodocyclaceae bacterium]